MPPVGDDPVARRRRGDHAIIIGIRPERPSSIVRPESEYLEKELLEKEIGEAPPSRLERVGLLTELGVSAPASRARGLSAIKTNAHPKPLVFQCRLLAMTP